MSGYFITFEGGEGVGKTTQISRLASHLRDAGYEVVETREPGGSPGAEAVRYVLLSGAAEPLGQETEAVLFAAARSDHVETVIRPALERGAIVLCDRFMDSSRVYQGLSGKLDKEFMSGLERVAVNGIVPDRTFILDIDVAEGMARAGKRRGEDTADRYEKEDLKVHEERRQGFLDIAKKEPERCVVINASADADSIANEIAFSVAEMIARRDPVKLGN